MGDVFVGKPNAAKLISQPKAMKMLGSNGEPRMVSKKKCLTLCYTFFFVTARIGIARIQLTGIRSIPRKTFIHITSNDRRQGISNSNNSPG